MGVTEGFEIAVRLQARGRAGEIVGEPEGPAQS